MGRKKRARTSKLGPEKEPRLWRPTNRQVLWAIGLVVALVTITLLVDSLYPAIWQALSRERVAMLIGIGVALVVVIFLLASVRPDGTGFKVITNTPGADEASSPDWSPDGRRLVFQHYLNATEFNRIETIRADGTGLRIVFEPRNLKASNPVFSPDGTKIAFSYESGMDIWKINPDGTGLTDVTNTPERWESSPDWGPMPTATTTR
jgi:hypothetical protein